MATVRKRGNLQGEDRIRKRGYPTTSKTFETKADAEAWARLIESEMDRGIFVSRTEAENRQSKPHRGNRRYSNLTPISSLPCQVQQNGSQGPG